MDPFNKQQTKTTNKNNMILAEQIITSSDIYWITRLDGINNCATGVSILSGIAFFFFTIFSFCATADKMWEILPLFIRTAIISGICFALSLIILVFVPTTKEAIIIYGLPKVVNNEKVQQKVSSAVDGSEELLSLAKEYITKKVREDAPKQETK